MERLIRLFAYCGVTKEEYNSVKKDAYVNNFNVWKYLHFFLALAFCVSFIEAILYAGFSKVAVIRLVMLVYFIVVGFIFLTPLIKKDSIIGQLIIYLSMVVLLIGTFLLGISNTEMMAVSFTVMLLFLPMFMIDKPYFMAIVLCVSAFIYCFHADMFKSGIVLKEDKINIITFAVLGIIINTFYNALRVREFLARKRSAAKNEVLQRMSESLIEVLGEVVESRDANSGNHINRVKGYTNILANMVRRELPEYKLDDYTVRIMTSASALHDVGKISIPDDILLKPGKLTDEEFEIMKTHSAKGCEILKKMEHRWSDDYYSMCMDICAYHHEKWDGCGYPNGLKGDEIPIAAQIVSIADAYDALTTKRPYKDPFTADEAYEMIMDGQCGAFSDKLLACFSKCRDDFAAHAADKYVFEQEASSFELTMTGLGQNVGFVIGFHDRERTLSENIRLNKELTVISGLSDQLLYSCYVDMAHNEVIHYSADPRIRKVIDTLDLTLPSNKRLDQFLNTIIVSEDIPSFRKRTERPLALSNLEKYGSVNTMFKIGLEDGIHRCRMKIVKDPQNADCVLIGIMNVDEEP